LVTRQNQSFIDGLIAPGTGRVGFVDAGDIAAAAVAALVAPTALNRNIVLTGLEALSYDELAGILCRVAVRMRTPHTRLQQWSARHAEFYLYPQRSPIMGERSVYV